MVVFWIQVLERRLWTARQALDKHMSSTAPENKESATLAGGENRGDSVVVWMCI